MMFALLLAAAALPPAPPSAADVANSKATLRREAEATRAAIDAAVQQRLLGSGLFRLVTDKRERRRASARFQKHLRSIGIPAAVGECQWIGLVAEGVKDGNLSYGGACRVRIASRPPADFLICEASLGGLSLVKPEWFASDSEYIELFIRRACL